MHNCIKKKVFKNGFSILEAMIAVGILGVISAATISLILMITQAGVKSKFDTDVTNDYAMLRILLSKEEICTANFRNLKLSSHNELSVSMKEYIPATKELGTAPLINSNILNKSTLLLSSTPDIANLNLEFKSPAKTLGPELIYRKIILNVELNSSQRIKKCAAFLENSSPTTQMGLADVPIGKPGTYPVAFPKSFSRAPMVFIQPKWLRRTGDEDSTWWVTNVTVNGFDINVSTPGGGSNRGENGVMWMATEPPISLSE